MSGLLQSLAIMNSYLLASFRDLKIGSAVRALLRVESEGFVPHTQLKVKPGYGIISWHWDPFEEGGSCKSCQPASEDLRFV